MKRIVIIGGGIAGTTAAQEARRRDAEAEIIIIEQEPHRVYSKVLLAKYIIGEIDRDRLFLKSEDWYQEQKIELMTNTRALHIDLKNKFVEVSGNREVPYDILIMATGQQPRVLEQDMRGMVYLRSLDDAQVLKSLINELKTQPPEQQRMILIGGSFIAMEYIHIAQALDIPISIILRSGGFWSKVLSKDSQAYLIDKAKELGIDIYTGSPFRILGSERVEGVELESGDVIHGSIIAVGIGVEVEKGWLKESLIPVEQGIVCDSGLQVAPSLFAAGDVSEFYDMVYKRQFHIGNWTHAIMQGKCVGENSLGGSRAYEFVSSHATRLGDVEISFIGCTDREFAQKVVCLKTEKGFVELFEKEGVTIGAVLIGSSKERPAITKAIKEQKQYEYKTSA